MLLNSRAVKRHFRVLTGEWQLLRLQVHDTFSSSSSSSCSSEEEREKLQELEHKLNQMCGSRLNYTDLDSVECRMLPLSLLGHSQQVRDLLSACCTALQQNRLNL